MSFIGVADAVKVVAFQAVLIFVALVLGADLDNEVRSNALIAFEVWIRRATSNLRRSSTKSVSAASRHTGAHQPTRQSP